MSGEWLGRNRLYGKIVGVAALIFNLCARRSRAPACPYVLYGAQILWNIDRVWRSCARRSKWDRICYFSKCIIVKTSLVNDKIIRCLDTTYSSVTTSAHCEGISEEILCCTINERKICIVFLPDCFSPWYSNLLVDCCQEAPPTVGHGAPHIHVSFDCPRLLVIILFLFFLFQVMLLVQWLSRLDAGRGQSLCYFRWAVWHWDRACSEYLCFPQSVSFHNCSFLIHSFTTDPLCVTLLI